MCGRVLAEGPFGALRCHATKTLCENCGHCFLGNDGTWTSEGYHCICTDEQRIGAAFMGGLL